MLALGSTFLVPTPPLFNVKHLFIIIAIQSNLERALVVNVTSERNECEGICFLEDGEHPFITHRSKINYARAKITKISKLEESIKNGKAEEHQSINDTLLKRIRQGALISQEIPGKCYDFLCSNF